MPTYTKCLNNEKREDLGWTSPFEMYFWRRSNELFNATMNADGQITTERTCQPTDADFLSLKKITESWRRKAEKVSDRIDKQKKKYHAKKHLYRLY